MKITFLGTSSAAPTRGRNVTSIALQLPQRGALWLFDCGEGTQHQILRSPLRLSQLEKVFLTHLHGDHLFGLMGMLASRSMQNGGTTPVTLYGPAGLEEYVRVSLQVSRTHLGYPICIETVGKQPCVCEDAHTQVFCAPMQHGIETYGYAIVEKDKPGHFNVQKARELGIPEGPVYTLLKNGETVTLADGRQIDGRELTGLPILGRKIVFCGDTTYNARAVTLAQEADLLIHEATFMQEDRQLADRARHATSVMAAQVAKEAGVKSLLLTHLSARYESEGGSRLGDLLAEAQAVFPNTRLAYDFLTVEVPRRG